MNSIDLPHRERIRPGLRKGAARILAVLAVVTLISAPAWADPLLSPDAVARIFCSRTSEAGGPFLPISVVVVEGAFTAPGMTEAVVTFSDANQSHALGIAEIWLLRLVKGQWEPVVKIAEADTADFVTTDLNGDGTLELLTHTSTGNQGYFVINRRLIYFSDGNPADLLTFEGFDNTGWPDKGICAFDARFAFVDVNRDAAPEVELTEYYDYCQKQGDTSVFLRRSERTTVFRPLISPSGSIVGIERLR
jgi:hypothetical protein